MLVDLGFDVCGVSIFARENAEEILKNILHFTDYCTSCTSRKNETTMPNKFRCVVECFPTEIFSPSNPQRLYEKGARSAKTFIHPRGMAIRRAINVGQRFFSSVSGRDACLLSITYAGLVAAVNTSFVLLKFALIRKATFGAP